jgi:hypothetical protein
MIYLHFLIIIGGEIAVLLMCGCDGVGRVMQYMQSEDEKRNVDNEAQSISWLTEKYQFPDIEGLTALFEPLQVCCGWCSLEEWESFNFCLRQFLNNIDLLYRVRLPELAAYTSQQVEQAPRSEKLRESRYIWTCLRAIVRLLEQTEPFCQLINSCAYRLLEVLDGDSDMEAEQAVSGKDGNAGRKRLASSQEEWEHGSAVVLELLKAWRRYQDRCQIFLVQFVDLIDDIPGLVQVDSAFNLLLDHACSLFGNILPKFHSSSGDSDEAIATLLLDMMQKIDLLLWQIDILLEVLHPLEKLYAITAEMY